MKIFWGLFLLLAPTISMASASETLDLTDTTFGYIAVIVFILAYLFVIGEEFIDLRKSKPVLIAAGIIWMLVAAAFTLAGKPEVIADAARHNLLEFAELMLFLLVAMTYVNTMQERQVFNALRAWLVSRQLSMRTIFWVTGGLAFCISPIADNLTTALLMGAVVIAVGGKNTKFVTVGCINIVVAANAGGAFSPFGDITTLMVWQKGLVTFTEFFSLFLPSLVNWLIPAFFMSLVISREKPEASNEEVRIRTGGITIIFLFLLTIALTVTTHTFLHLPPVIGMMFGLGILKVYGYHLKRVGEVFIEVVPAPQPSTETKDLDGGQGEVVVSRTQYDIFKNVQRAEWDTLMFFYGVIMCVGGLGTLGYLAMVSELLYGGLGPTWSNIIIGILSAIVDNIPVMFAVLTMQPEMPLEQWLLVTLTAGVGGSLLSIGSAAGVALMGQARGIYTFFSHLRWTWAIALGYAGSIWTHFLLNMS